MAASTPLLSESFYAPHWESRRNEGLRLFCEIDNHHFYLSGLLAQEQASIFFEHYSLNKTATFLAPENIKAVHQQLKWLGNVPILKLTAALQNIPFELLPNEFSNTASNGGWQCTDTHEILNGKIIYEVPNAVNASLQAYCSNIGLKHALSGLLHQTKKMMETLTDGILCNLHADTFDIIVWQNKQIKMLNTFAMAAPEDLIYFIQLAMQQHKMDAHEQQLLVGGEVIQQSLVYTTLSKFFSKIDFANRATMPNQGALKGLLPHRFLTFSGIISCE